METPDRHAYATSYMRGASHLPYPRVLRESFRAWGLVDAFP
jgi:hypothetical protein